jgi:hypothetical protein
MSGPLFSYRYPFEVPPHPSLEPEVQQAILASWASRADDPGQRASRHRPAGHRRHEIDSHVAPPRDTGGTRREGRGGRA